MGQRAGAASPLDCRPGSLHSEPSALVQFAADTASLVRASPDYIFKRSVAYHALGAL